MVTGVFRIELPADAWIHDVSTSCPDVRFRLLSGIEATGESAVELGETSGEAAVEAAAAVGEHPEISEFETLYAGDDRVLSQYRTADRSLYDFLRDASLPPEFPLVVEDGWLECEVTAPRERLTRLEAKMAQSELAYGLRSIVDSPEDEGLLTDRQRELLAAGLASGYYEVPREQTLTELASEVGIDPSTASGVIRRAERQVVAWFLTSATESSYEQYTE